MNKTLAALLFMLSVGAAHAVYAADVATPAARTIVLVRHGHYVADPAVDEKPGPGLSPLGVAQARLAGARLAGMGVRFDSLQVSPLQRARDTAATISLDLPGRGFGVLADLEECTPPTRRADIMAKGAPESFAACKAQLDRLFVEHFRVAEGVDRTDLFVCHGNVIRYLVTRALGVDPMAWLEMSPGHASITRIRVEADGRFKLIGLGDTGHLPPNMQTGATGDRERSLAIPSLPQP